MNQPDSPRRPRLLPLLLAELKRRGVLRAAGFYLVGAWVVIQVVATVFPPLGLSERWVAVMVVVAIAGFPITVIAAWLYRLGVDVETEQLPAGLGLRPSELRFTIALAILVGVGLLGFSGWIALRPGGPPPTTSSAPAGSRLAVLYFANHSSEPADAYLSSALTETLIEQLGQVEGLTVISSNGVRPYRDADVSPDSIGAALNVGLLVGGSVLVADSMVRVGIELTDAATGDVLVTHRVERPVANTFALVDEVVKDAAEFLRAQVGNQLELRQWQAGTRDPEAWRLLQRARQLEADSRELLHRAGPAAALSSLAEADSLLSLAEKFDPDFTAATVQRAWVEYGRAYLWFSPGGGNDASLRAAVERGVMHAGRALRKQRTSAAALEVRGTLREMLSAFAPPATAAEKAELVRQAEDDLRAALQLEPERARALSTLSSLLQARSDYQQALLFAERAYRADAYLEDASNILNRLFTLSFERADDAPAEQWCAELKRRDAGQVGVAFCELMLAGWSQTHKPDIAAAWNTASGPLASSPPQVAAFLRPHLEVLTAAVIARAGLADSARAVLRRVDSVHSTDPELLQLEASVRLLLGERKAAEDLLTAYVKRRPGTGVVHSRRFQGLAIAGVEPG